MNKILRYLGVIMGCLSCLALFVAPFGLVVTSGLTKSSSSEGYGLFADLSGVDTVYKTANKTFQPFWITVFQIAVITTLVVSAIMLLVYILNDLGVLKVKKIEKLLSVVLIVAGAIALVSIAGCSIFNTFSVEIATVKTTTKFVGSLLGWLVSVFAILGGILAGVDSGKKGKKKK
jgi:hypothetical protein